MRKVVENRLTEKQERKLEICVSDSKHEKRQLERIKITVYEAGLFSV